MIYGFIAFGGIAFWILVALALSISLLFSSSHSPDARLSGTNSTMAVGIVALVGFTYGAPGFITPDNVITVLAAYILIAVVWGTGRWFVTLAKIRQAVMARGEDETGPQLWARLARDFRLSSYPPTPSQYTSQLWYWTVWWPFDMVGLVLSGPVRFLYERVVLIYSSMARAMFKGVDLPEDNG